MNFFSNHAKILYGSGEYYYREQSDGQAILSGGQDRSVSREESSDQAGKSLDCGEFQSAAHAVKNRHGPEPFGNLSVCFVP